MKTKTIFLLTALLLIFSCSTSEEPDAQILEVQNLKSKSPMMEVLAKKANRNALMNAFNTKSAKGGNGNGVIFIKNGADYVACGGGDDFLACVYEMENGFYKSPIDVQILPNGEAQFIGHSKEFAVEIYTLPNFELIYSNLCMDEFIGNLHINLKGTFEIVDDDPLVDFEYYTYVEGSTANNFQMTAVVEDGVRNLDIDALTWDCVEATTQKRVKATSLFMPNGKMNLKIQGL